MQGGAVLQCGLPGALVTPCCAGAGSLSLMRMHAHISPQPTHHAPPLAESRLATAQAGVQDAQGPGAHCRPWPGAQASARNLLAGHELLWRGACRGA